MIRICTSLSTHYDVELWGRKKSDESATIRGYGQKRFNFIINSGPLFYLFYNIRLFINLLLTKVDILHAVDLDTLPACYFASKIKGTSLVYDSHEYFTEVPELIYRPKVRRIWLLIERRILPKVKNAITVGNKIALEYQEKYNVHFTVIRNCPRLTEKPKVESKVEPYLLYQGALNKGRGLEALIGAMPKLDMELKIAGTGDIDRELKTLVRSLGVEDKVHFLGMLKPEELPPLSSSAFAGINVSENLGLSYYYSLNNKFFDYIHAGIPAITNPFPEYEALNEKYDCLVFASAKSEEIAGAVKLLLNDKDRYSQLRKNSFLARQQLNWDKEGKKLLEFYKDIA